MNTTALGPTMAGGIQPIVEDGYELIYYPDVNNYELQREGKAPVFYYLPNYVHLATKNGVEDGDRMFSMTRFSGVQNSSTTVGVTGDETREVAGGVLAFTATSAPPDHVLEASQQKIIEKFQAKDDFFWGIRGPVEPHFRPVIIMSNTTSVSNLSPNADAEVILPEDGTDTTDPSSPATPSGPTRQSGYKSYGIPPFLRSRNFTPRDFGRKTRDASSGLDPWYWTMQGQGNGSIDPMGQNAYSALVGAYPAALLWESFHGAYSPIFVQQALQTKFWLPSMEITIRGNWDKVFEHFSAAASARYLWFQADIQAEFNKMKISGGIEVEVKVDTTIPGAEDIEKYINERTDLVFQKFMDQAKQKIFDPPQPEVEAAQAESGGLGIWGAGLSLKYRRDSTSLDLYYHEKRQMTYLHNHTISSSLEGLADIIEENPEKEDLYFHTVYLEDWPKKLSRILKPVVNWPQPDQNWAGEPVAFLSAQVGYPNTNGETMWQGKVFQKTDPEDSTWNVAMSQKFADDVDNIPAGWEPDKTFIKRNVHFLEAPDQTANPFVSMQISDNMIELDPEEGSLVNDITLEVRADKAAKVRVGPISLNVELESSKQVVEVYLRAIDDDGRPIDEFDTIKFAFGDEDQQTGRFWSLFTSNPDVRSIYEYQVRAIVKGSFFTKGMEWIGPWTRSIGNGPLMINVPTPEDEGVQIVKEYKGKPAGNPEPTPPSTTPSSEPVAPGSSSTTVNPPRSTPVNGNCSERTFKEIK